MHPPDTLAPRTRRQPHLGVLCPPRTALTVLVCIGKTSDRRYRSPVLRLRPMAPGDSAPAELHSSIGQCPSSKSESSWRCGSPSSSAAGSNAHEAPLALAPLKRRVAVNRAEFMRLEASEAAAWHGTHGCCGSRVLW